MIAWGDALDISAQTDDAQGRKKAKETNLENLLLFIYIGVVAGSCAWVYTSLFKITGYRQGAYWRKSYLEAVLRQDIAWFDKENPVELPTKIAEKTQQLEEGVSSKLGEGAMFFAQFVGGIVVGFIYA
jgi:ABC-type multidrug transport system fused ATPase/permease subunit